MSKKNTTIAIIVVATLIIFGIFFVLKKKSDEGLHGVEREKTSEEIKKEQSEAAQFSLEDYSGATVTSKDFKGKILVVNAWATWCPFCVNELPDFVELQKAYPDEIVVVAINRSEPKAIAKGYTDEFNLTKDLVFLVDPKDSFYKSIGGFAMPETLFIDTKGNISIHKRGPLKFDEMKKMIVELLSLQ